MSVGDRSACFFDTSAFVKRYHEEAGTAVIDAAFADAGIVKLISDLCVIEFYSAFARKARMGIITVEDFRNAVKGMSIDINTGVVKVLYLRDEDKKVAVSLLERYAINSNRRTLDPLHLAVMNKH